ncbi:MAG: hypothetical protein K6U80_19190, partial [Firmicutes bacterium]|nr:hypothetical protein [Bacillota bacterium]
MPKKKITFICMTIFLLTLLISNQVLLADTLPLTDLVAYYPFNGNANDESGNGNHGTVYGATLSSDRFGIQNKAYSFDRINDFISVNTNQLSITQSISISVWIKNTDISYTDDGYGGASNYVISKGVYGVHPYNDYYMNIGQNRLSFHIINNSGTMYTATGNISDLIYHHIVGIYDYANSKLKLYIDGVLVDEISASGRIKNSNNSFYIGDWNGASLWHFWKGLIDDIRIYNRPLSETEVQNLYHEGDWPILLQNPNFDNGVDGWHCVNNGTNAQANIIWDTVDYASTPGSLKVQCYNNGASYKDIQILTNRFNLVKDRTYLLTFNAKSSAGFTIPSIKLNQAVSPWTDYAAPNTGLPIGTGWQDYAAIFTANATASDVRVTFFLGDALPDGTTFNLDDVSLKEFVVNTPTAGELLLNPGFDLGNAGWNFYSDSTAQAKGYLDPSDFDTA